VTSVPQPVDTTRLVQTAEALANGTVATAEQLAWALGEGTKAVYAETLPEWEWRAALAVMALGGSSPADLLHEIAYRLDNTAAQAAPAPQPAVDPLGGVLSGQAPPVPGAAPAAPQAAPAAPQAAPAAASTATPRPPRKPRAR
jgi:hypothetical protein